MEFILHRPILIAIIIIGVLAILIGKMFWDIRKKTMSCPCGGQVTPIAEYGPCGCHLAPQPPEGSRWEEQRVNSYN